MVKTKDKEIDGLKVTVTQFPARRGFVIQAKLIRIFGPVMATVLAGKKIRKGSGFMDTDITVESMGAAVQKLFEAMDEEKALALILELLQSTRIDNQEVNVEIFDLTFAGKYASLFKVLGFVLEVNFGDFFGDGGIGKKLIQVAKT